MAVIYETPPPPPKFDITPEALINKAESIAKAQQEAVEEILNAVTAENATFENTIVPLAHANNEFDVNVTYIGMFQSLSPSEDLRNASAKAIAVNDQAARSLWQNGAVFALVDAVRRRGLSEEVNEESRRLVDRYHRYFVESGLELSEDSQKRCHDINKSLNELRTQFMENIGKDPGSVWKTEEELKGLGRGKLDGLEKDTEGRRRIMCKKPDSIAVLSQCEDSQTRKDVYVGDQSAYPDNVAIFKQMMLLRDEQARLFDNRTFASRKLEHALIKSPDKVSEFLSDLKERTRHLVRDEIQALEKFSGLSTPLHVWDFSYYHDKLLKQRYNVDHELVSEYFPATVTIRKMLQVFETLFSLSIVEREDRDEGDVWHPDVDIFNVWDKESGAFIAYLYTDIYPRYGKYNHAANFNIYPGYLDKDGRQLSTGTALVCNASQSAEGLPALLKHSEVITIFHELGHAMHDLLGRTQYASFHGHRTVSDFTEAPSQLLESWCWVPDCLQKLSCHYSYISEEYKHQWLKLKSSTGSTQPPKEIPETLIKDLIAAKKLNQGILTSRQVAFSLFDMRVHNPRTHEELDSMNTGNVYNSLYEELTGLKGLEAGRIETNGHVTTPHYIWGVQSSYYSYLYTRIIATDLWQTCFQKDPMSPETGLRYRRTILGRGGSRDEMENLIEFLGRPPNSDAYLAELA